ncbi:MAG: hypothetical protein C0621_06980 [Desulfuromonas sp.]|nr:MAG: hypothetical protein C0621_06980 [Desulfuromonas sp.]
MTSKIDLGLALLDMERWYRISLDREFRVLELCGQKGGLPLSGLLTGDRFLDHLDQKGQEAFLDGVAGSREGRPCNRLLNLNDGTPLEIIVVDRDKQLDLFFCNIKNRLNSLGRLSIFYRHFLTSPNAICFTSENGEILDANRAFLDLYGYQLSEVRGENPRILKSGRQSPDAYRELWQRLTDPEFGHWTGELINRKRNGEEVNVLLTVSSVRRTNGELIGFIANALDITRRKQLESELSGCNLELMKLNRLKSELMAITSHDLKSPINAIISRIRLMQEEIDEIDKEEISDHLQKIVEQGMRMTGLINDLLDLEKIEAGNFELNSERTRLPSLLRFCIDTHLPTAHEKGIDILLHAPHPGEPMRLDVLKMEQVFNNLLSNALKFSPPNTTIEVSYLDEGSGSPKIVTVRDQGPGIPETVREKIFDRYFQVEQKGGLPTRAFGVGLGLSIVKNIVDLHSGRVSVSNHPDGGCIFSVELTDRGTIRSAKDVSALVVDFHENFYQPLRRHLDKKGLTSFQAVRLEEAKRLIDFEQPELIFFGPQELNSGMLALIEPLRQRKEERPLLIEICSDGDSTVDAELVDEILIPPITETEIDGLFKDCQFCHAHPGEKS